jgi:hypothetical protein
MREPIVQVDTLLKADKGRAAGQFAVPPIQYDGAGYPFAVDSSGDRIAICNDANLLLLDLKRRSKRLLRAPLSDQTEFWGVAFAPQNRLYVFLSDYTVALLNLQGSLLKRFGGGFGERADQFAGAPPYRLAVRRDGSLLIHENERLYLYSPAGEPLSRLDGIVGFAADKQGRIWCQGDKPLTTSKEVRRVEMPASLSGGSSAPNMSWYLFGADHWNSFYWAREWYIKEAQTLITEVARTRADGSLSWRVQLNGRGGVLRDLIPKSQVQWLTVDEAGRLYVLGWTFRGIKRAVGLYRVSVST